MEYFIIIVLIIAIGVLIGILMHTKSALKAKIAYLTELAGKINDLDVYTRKAHTEAERIIKRATSEAEDIRQQTESEKQNLNTLKKKIKDLKSELKTLEIDSVIQMVKIDTYDGLKSDEVKNQLAMLSTRQDALVREEKTVVVTKSISDKKVLNSQIKQLLRCFNSECSGILGAVTVKNADTSRGKITRTYEALNKIFAVDGVQISVEYLATKYEELSLIYAYMVKEEEEKEQRRAIREQMVEEEKVRKEIEREKAKIEKEQSQFSNEVNKLMSYMQKAKDDIERQLYIDKINELEEKLKALEVDKENVLQREQNTRAGFVYIISNIGSFGEHVYKIGMTRRLEPMDRIAELSSASVPFPFDVHAMIFSDDAPGLENILHQYFDEKRVNRVNPRKEFFHVDLNEIKKVVLENHNATVKFIEEPDAVEYRETLKLTE